MGGYDNGGYDVDSKDRNYNSKGGHHERGGSVQREDMTEADVRREKFRIMKNVVLISFSFLLLFTAFQSMANLQSSINKDAGLGTWSLSVIYAALVVSCMFLPTAVIKRFKCKWAMVGCMLCYTTYILAQFYPTFYTLIPGAIILGMGAAPMWSAKCTYLTQVGNKYAELSGVSTEPVIVRFFGIFFLFFQFSSVVGNLLASTILSTGGDDNSTETASVTEKDYYGQCGVNYCPAAAAPPPEDEDGTSDAVDSNFQTDKTRFFILASVYLACSVLSGIIVAIFVDPLSRYGEDERDDGEKLSGVQLLVATFKHMKKPYQLLIIPLTFWSGIEQGFFGADFTAGYVSCAYSVQNLGYVLIVYGVCDAICSFSFGFFIKYVGRVPIFIGGAVVNLIVVGILFTWTPNPDQAYAFFLLAGAWGVADAVWQTQINALYGVLFEKDEEAAFANYRLWESLGFIVAYVLQNAVCIYTKLWVVVGVLLTGMVGYLVIEFTEWKKRP